MSEHSYPVEDQMITAVTVKDGNAQVLAGTTLLSKPRGIVVRFEAHDTDAVPSKGRTVTLLYGGGVRVLRLRTIVAEVIDGLKLLLEPVSEVTEGERREFLRAESLVKLHAEVVGPDYVLPGETGAPPGPDMTELMADLSGSGVRFLWDSLCAIGDLMFVRLVLSEPQNSVVCAVGEVVRADRDAESGTIDVAVHFTTIEEQDRDRLINFVFRRYYEQLGSALGAVIDPE